MFDRGVLPGTVHRNLRAEQMNAREKFGVNKEATAGEVKLHWQTVAVQNHPDHGGDVKGFLKQQELFKKALKESLTPVPCSVCKGSGKVKKTSGFYSLDFPCPECKNK